jgi:tetratricopeptide (TPR) repeat protein
MGKMPMPHLWSAAAVAACLAGMATKEVMAVAPLLVLLYDRAFLAGSFAQALRRRWKLYAALAATWVLLVYVVAGSGSRPGTGGAVADVTPLQYAGTQFKAVLGYIGQSFWPGELVFEYGEPKAQSAAAIAPCAVIVGLLLAATAVAMVRWKAWGFLGAWFFMILAPTSTIIRLSQARAEHRMYLPLAALAVAGVLAAYLLGSILLRRVAKDESARRRVGLGLWSFAAVAIPLTLGYLTLQRNGDYRSEFSIWNDTVGKCPDNARALEALGIELGKRDRPLEAISDFNRAIQLRSGFAKTYANRGAVYQQLGRFEEAIRDFDKAIGLDGNFASAYANRGVAYGGLGRFDLAIRDLDKAIALRSDYGEAYRNRAWAHYLVKDYGRAWADIRSARRYGAPPDPRVVRQLESASGRSE